MSSANIGTQVGDLLSIVKSDPPSKLPIIIGVGVTITMTIAMLVNHYGFMDIFGKDINLNSTCEERRLENGSSFVVISNTDLLCATETRTDSSNPSTNMKD